MIQAESLAAEDVTERSVELPGQDIAGPLLVLTGEQLEGTLAISENTPVNFDCTIRITIENEATDVNCLLAHRQQTDKKHKRGTATVTAFDHLSPSYSYNLGRMGVSFRGNDDCTIAPESIDKFRVAYLNARSTRLNPPPLTYEHSLKAFGRSHNKAKGSKRI